MSCAGLRILPTGLQFPESPTRRHDFLEDTQETEIHRGSIHHLPGIMQIGRGILEVELLSVLILKFVYKWSSLIVREALGNLESV